MRSITGSYRVDAAAASYFGSGTIRLLAREARIAGRFGRTGTIGGTLNGRCIEALWRDAKRAGWMRLIFDPDYRAGTCSYGPAGAPSLGESAFARLLVRRKRRAAAQQ